MTAKTIHALATAYVATVTKTAIEEPMVGRNASPAKERAGRLAFLLSEGGMGRKAIDSLWSEAWDAGRKAIA